MENINGADDIVLRASQICEDQWIVHQCGYRYPRLSLTVVTAADSDMAIWEARKTPEFMEQCMFNVAVKYSKQVKGETS